jgi:aspartate carbamoyltransferase catalytic subunit
MDWETGGEMISSIAGGNLLNIDDLTREAIIEVLDTAESFLEVSTRAIKKVPTLKGRVVASLFYEESTRTRLSFETAAKRLSADVISLAVAASSVKKGESLRDTASTIEALGVDAVVIRHQSSGAPHHVAAALPGIRIINAGDGQHQHPTQGLLDVFTLRQALSSRAGTTGSESGAELFKNLKVLIVGDIRHSRVARSDAWAYATLGSTVRICAPGTLLPDDVSTWPVEVMKNFDEALEWADVVGLLRLQNERGSGTLVPSLAEFTRSHGLTQERHRRLAPHVLITHPGPMNRGVEIDSLVADADNALISQQVANGVPVRMAVLYLALAGGEPKGYSHE